MVMIILLIIMIILMIVLVIITILIALYIVCFVGQGLKLNSCRFVCTVKFNHYTRQSLFS